MTHFCTISFFNALLLLAPIASTLAASIGNCHPYPGAAAQDCLELIGQNLGSEDQTSCIGGRATITLRNCSITTTCGTRETAIANDDAVRRALTAIGSCALSDMGSISGYYIADNGDKTCYLYPGK
jgi:hypothetical protein